VDIFGESLMLLDFVSVIFWNIFTGCIVSGNLWLFYVDNLAVKIVVCVGF